MNLLNFFWKFPNCWKFFFFQIYFKKKIFAVSKWFFKSFFVFAMFRSNPFLKKSQLKKKMREKVSKTSLFHLFQVNFCWIIVEISAKQQTLSLISYHQIITKITNDNMFPVKSSFQYGFLPIFFPIFLTSITFFSLFSHLFFCIISTKTHLSRLILFSEFIEIEPDELTEPWAHLLRFLGFFGEFRGCLPEFSVFQFHVSLHFRLNFEEKFPDFSAEF